MKKKYFLVLISSLLAMFFSLNCSSSKEGAVSEKQDTKTAEIKTEKQMNASVTIAPRMSIKGEKYIFKDATEGDTVVNIWEIKNIGTDTLYISDVESSCGCTAAFLDSKIVAPNSSTKMKASFNTTARIGINTKTVIIHSNDPASPNKTLILEGRVIAKAPPKTN